MEKYLGSKAKSSLLTNILAFFAGLYAPSIWTAPLSAALSSSLGASGKDLLAFLPGLILSSVFSSGGIGVLLGGMLSYFSAKMLVHIKPDRPEAYAALSAMLGCLLPSVISLARMDSYSAFGAILSCMIALACAPVMLPLFLRPFSLEGTCLPEERIAHSLSAVFIIAGASCLFPGAGLILSGIFVLIMSSGGILSACLGALISSVSLLAGGFDGRTLALVLMTAGIGGAASEKGVWAQTIMFLLGIPLSVYLGFQKTDAFYLSAACLYPLIPVPVTRKLLNLFIARAKEKAPPYSITAFRLHKPPAGLRVCGDCGAIERVERACMLLMLADGMGTGKPAQELSRRAVNAARTFLKSDSNEKSAMEAVNRMTMAEETGEAYSTLDACVVSLESGRARFYKSCAEPTWILKQKGVIRIESQSLPLGIVTNARPEKRRIRLKAGDTVFMATDGLISAAGGADSLECMLIRLKNQAPGSICKSVIREAHKNAAFVHPDDMSVLCARLQRRTERGKRNDHKGVIPINARLESNTNARTNEG
ncbi:MAG: SpoIIE family protein phosphatase [Clostridia bacterium]|nr:SpoIIE family protein phosphatase [Clostridia bacterium]